jgi:hypothetical protein
MNQTEQPSDGQTPAQRAELIAVFACLASMVCLFLVSQPVGKLLQVWWAGTLLCLLFPIGLTFTILYGSCVHREMGRLARAFFLFLSSLLIYGGICVALAIVAFVAVAILPLSRFHN